MMYSQQPRNMGERVIIAAMVRVDGAPVAAQLIQGTKEFSITETLMEGAGVKNKPTVVMVGHTAMGIAEAFCRRYGIVVSSRLFEGRAS